MIFKDNLLGELSRSCGQFENQVRVVYQGRKDRCDDILSG